MRAKVVVVLTFLLFSVASGLAGTETVLYSFTGGTDGAQPFQAGVIFNQAGDLYGVTQYGGAYGQGTVFELSPSPGGTWTETVIYSFTGGSDGANPQGGLATDGLNIYGTTAYGGEDNDSCGTFFIVNKGAEGQLQVLHTFNDLTLDGCQPESDLSFDGYATWGTTAYGGGNKEPGTVFVWAPGGDYGIQSAPGNSFGSYPTGLTLFGNSIYATAYSGGPKQLGSVFERFSSRKAKAKHTFITCKDGCFPVGDLATQVNANGARIMYGTNSAGGDADRGTVYQLTDKKDDDKWAASLLHSFSGSDGAYPWGGVILDPAGNLYGTASAGGTENSGTVFELTPGAKNTWTYTLLYSFSGGTDGNSPTGSLVLDSAGNLYGTTNYGGAYGQGVVYEITP